MTPTIGLDSDMVRLGPEGDYLAHANICVTLAPISICKHMQTYALMQTYANMCVNFAPKNTCKHMQTYALMQTYANMCVTLAPINV